MNMAKNLDLLNWLGEWINSQCDGDWEHEIGIQLIMYDNPAIGLKIDLVKFEDHMINLYCYHDLSSSNWISVKVDNGYMTITGTPLMLNIIFLCFQESIIWLCHCNGKKYNENVVRQIINKISVSL